MTRFLLIFILITPGWVWGEKYLCIADAATGFKFQNGKWAVVSFVAKHKYIVTSDLENSTVHRFGHSDPMYTVCANKDAELFCSATSVPGIGAFEMSKNTLRYMVTYTSRNYIYRLDEFGNGTPFMEIGKCSKL